MSVPVLKDAIGRVIPPVGSAGYSIGDAASNELYTTSSILCCANYLPNTFGIGSPVAAGNNSLSTLYQQVSALVPYRPAGKSVHSFGGFSGSQSMRYIIYTTNHVAGHEPGGIKGSVSIDVFPETFQSDDWSAGVGHGSIDIILAPNNIIISNIDPYDRASFPVIVSTQLKGSPRTVYTITVKDNLTGYSMSTNFIIGYTNQHFDGGGWEWQNNIIFGYDRVLGKVRTKYTTLPVFKVKVVPSDVWPLLDTTVHVGGWTGTTSTPAVTPTTAWTATSPNVEGYTS